ncbi:MAG: N-acetylmuramoyl-L-alanine amidase, partial [Firmicutes bacterium]|nr:N-acetylmuramoyl-L-alanine amidase [Bacillota bacterium]
TPIILVECGFLSNIEERNKLKTTEYQRTLAESVWAGLNENLALEKHESNEIVDSANKDKK